MHSAKTAALLGRTEGRIWLTDAGLETAMIFLEGLDLPHFASFTLLETDTGRARLAAYFDGFIAEARRHRTGFVLDTATWRASDGWADIMGISRARMAEINREAAAHALDLKARHEGSGVPIIVNGVFGPHGDAYAPDRTLTAAESRAYYAPQAEAFAGAGVEMLSGVTLSDVGQAVGIVQTAQDVGLPVVVSFTVETDGRLVSGMDLGEAIARTDDATGGAPAWYMVNCAHPDHFRDRLAGGWTARIGGVRANASRMSHAELDNSTELDAGDPDELAADYRALMDALPNLRVVGGCCGTDIRHVHAIGKACLGHAHAA
jgi:S-methylmethionine-dependent homocysteine/selenocysteine methylase